MKSGMNYYLICQYINHFPNLKVFKCHIKASYLNVIIPLLLKLSSFADTVYEQLCFEQCETFFCFGKERCFFLYVINIFI